MDQPIKTHTSPSAERPDGEAKEPASYAAVRGAVHRLEVFWDGEIIAESEVPAGLEPEIFNQLAHAQQAIDALRVENVSLQKYIRRLERAAANSKAGQITFPEAAFKTKKTNIKEKKPKKNIQEKKIKKPSKTMKV
jgi:hypothetical protein